MVQTHLTYNDKVPFLRTDQGHYNLYDNFLVKTALTSPFNSELRPEYNFYIHPSSSHSLQEIRLRPCVGAHRISKILMINNNIQNNSSNHTNIESTNDSRVKAKIITATQKKATSENKKELKYQGGLKRWKLGRPCNVWPECTDANGFAFIIKKNSSQNCPGISLQEKRQNTVQRSINTTCFALKVETVAQNTSKPIIEKCRIVAPKSTNTSCEHVKNISCATKISKKVTFDLSNIKSKSDENFIPNKLNLRKCKHSKRALKCNYAFAVNKAIFSECGQPHEGPAGILRNQNTPWDLKVNYGCSDFRKRLMLEMQRDEIRNTLGFPLKDSNENYNMYPFVYDNQAF
ncbi:uncharacterized protein LOC113226588 isoform X1 [Hyposmocoma kahamanoa]|uniref:uncharacterized protein LOC113226588 isoform X1 n=1 Tax=Hyposmocoma kahamanoa TaxID=1477025 RepID=UPI000E6D819E|nr:uncharacterized protein LOC113226588 isoform X1 [Hyposmocoma kahamanoa]XP_026315069.1 uncharacterized protein LOC113226588 isoform X1 [Hyposmocoma kahamanoa]